MKEEHQRKTDEVDESDDAEAEEKRVGLQIADLEQSQQRTDAPTSRRSAPRPRRRR